MDDTGTTRARRIIQMRWILYSKELLPLVMSGAKTLTSRVIRNVPAGATLATVLAGGIAVFYIGNGYDVVKIQ